MFHHVIMDFGLPSFYWPSLINAYERNQSTRIEHKSLKNKTSVIGIHISELASVGNVIKYTPVSNVLRSTYVQNTYIFYYNQRLPRNS